MRLMGIVGNCVCVNVSALCRMDISRELEMMISMADYT